jgi:ectoine hydroxylase-related dioxygenase (phytanoyl-CoA dioxygenase family)
MPSGFMAGAWIALEDVDRENGALVYYPGSHKLQEYNMQDLGYEAGRENYPDYEHFMENWAKTAGNEPYYGVMKKGQVLLWHANLLHGGSKHIDNSRTRHSQVTHYFFEGCKYYTPMYSTPDKIDWRDPNWIPREPEKLTAKIKRFIYSHI